MELPRNHFKAALAARRRQIGLWSSLCSNMVAEVIAHAGFDWIVLDTEHAPNEIPGLVQQMQAMAGGTAQAVIRPAWNDAVLIKRCLDAGAQSLLIPFVQTPEEAAAAVAATRYPPEGIRGVTSSGRAAAFGRNRTYVHDAAEEICVLVQVETQEALARIEEIATTPGVDGVFIGPADLAASMGHAGRIQEEAVQAAIRDACARLAAVGVASGVLSPIPEEAKKFAEWGFTFIAVGSDLGLLVAGSDARAAEFKGFEA